MSQSFAVALLAALALRLLAALFGRLPRGRARADAPPTSRARVPSV